MIPLPVQLIAGACVVAALGSLFRVMSRRPRQRVETLRLVASSVWDLDNLARTLDAALQAAPELNRVMLDLSGLGVVDDSAIAVLDYVCTRLHRAGVQIHIEGCAAAAASALARRGLPLVFVGQAGASAVSRGPTLH